MRDSRFRGNDALFRGSLGKLLIFKSLLLPPGLALLLGLIGLSIVHWRPRSGLVLLSAAALIGYVCSIPLTANLLARTLQTYPALTEFATWPHPQPHMIVVLGGGLHRDAPEYGQGPTIPARALQRVRYAAYLARRTGLPVLASGGIGHTDTDWIESAAHGGEAPIMQALLQQEFGLTAVRIESTSRDTWENAVNSAALLRGLDINSIVLVTDAIHLPRALGAFKAQGLTVIPAPTAFYDECLQPLRIRSWLPSGLAISTVHYVIHEWLGRLWYALRY